MNPLLPASALLAGLWWLILRRFPAPAQLQRRAQGQLLETLLYGDSPRVLGVVMLDMLVTSLRLLKALAPASLLSVAVTGLVAVGLRGYCNWRPPVVNEPVLVSATGGPNLRLGPGLRFDSPPLQNGSTTCWRLVGTAPGRHQLWVEQAQPAELVVGPAWAYLCPHQGDLEIYYPRREFWLNDRQLAWPLALGTCCLFWLATSGLLYTLGKIARKLSP